MRATGAKVISVETVPMRLFSGAEATEGFDTMHTWNRVVTRTHSGPSHGHHGHHGHSGRSHTDHNKGTEHYLTLYRAFIDGQFPEPFGMPALPSVEDYMRNQANSCAILWEIPLPITLCRSTALFL